MNLIAVHKRLTRFRLCVTCLVTGPRQPVGGIYSRVPRFFPRRPADSIYKNVTKMHSLRWKSILFDQEFAARRATLDCSYARSWLVASLIRNECSLRRVESHESHFASATRTTTKGESRNSLTPLAPWFKPRWRVPRSLSVTERRLHVGSCSFVRDLWYIHIYKR